MSELAKALAAFQAELPTVGKGNTARVEGKEGKAGYSYKYADLADVTKVVLPQLAKHGLSFSSKPTIDDGRFVLIYTLRHVSGEEDGGVYPLPVNATPQATGSAISYARRYALQAMTGVAADEDDDGQAAQTTRVMAERPQEWDPIEQDVLRTGWEGEIADAKDWDAIKDIGKKLLASKRSGEISPSTYEHLARAGAKRKAELNGGEGRGDSRAGEPPKVSPLPQEADGADRPA